MPSKEGMNKLIITKREYTMKKCTRCGLDRSEDSFNKDAARPDGLDCWCKDCTKAQRAGGQSKDALLANLKKAMS